MSIGRLEVLSGGETPLQPDDALAEAEHRIANSLAMVASLVRTQGRGLPQTATVPTADVRMLLAGISARIAAVGRLHRLLMSRGGCSTVELSDYLAEIASVVCAAFTDGAAVAVQTDLRAKPLIAIREAEAIGLVVSEALINALKHAAGASLALTLRWGERGSLVVEIADTGPGFPVDGNMRLSARKSSGIALMRAVAAELKADLVFDQSAGGLCTRLVLPAP
jgi:two-component sensor histidine kinase